MGYIETQERTICFGDLCSLTACIGVYFFVVRAYFEDQNNLYLTEETHLIAKPLTYSQEV